MYKVESSENLKSATWTGGANYFLEESGHSLSTRTLALNEMDIIGGGGDWLFVF